MKYNDRFVAAESIPILLITSSKMQNSVVSLLFSMNYFKIGLTWQFKQRYNMAWLARFATRAMLNLSLKPVIFSQITAVSQLLHLPLAWKVDKYISISRLGCMQTAWVSGKIWHGNTYVDRRLIRGRQTTGGVNLSAFFFPFSPKTKIARSQVIIHL